MNWVVALGIVAITVVAIAALREDPYEKRKGRGGDNGSWFGDSDGGDGGGGD